MPPLRAIACIIVVLIFSQQGFAQEKYKLIRLSKNLSKSQTVNLVGQLEIDHYQLDQSGAIVSEISETQYNKVKTMRGGIEVLDHDVNATRDNLNKIYFQQKATSRLPFEKTGSQVDQIISTPVSFEVKSTFGGYYRFSQMVSAMNQLVTTYPDLVQLTSLGKSHENRDIWCIKISDNVSADESGEPEVLYIGLQHAREAIGGSSMIFFMQYLCENYDTDSNIRDLVNNREIFIIPCMNPDGWEYNYTLNPNGGGGWRKNRRDNPGSTYGVDLNRNWGADWGNCPSGDYSCGSSSPGSDVYYGPSAFSEPETQAIRDFTYTRQFVAMIDQHAYGPYYSLPFGRPSLHSMDPLDQHFYSYVPAAMGNYNGMRAGNSPQSVGYEVAGGVKDWMLLGDIGSGTKGKIYGMTGEGGAGGGTSGSYGRFWPPASEIETLCKGMVFQNLQLLYAAGSNVELQDVNDINISTTSGQMSFHVRRVGLGNEPVSVSMIPIENIESVGTPVIISALNNYYDDLTGNIDYTLSSTIENGSRIKFAWQIQTGGVTHYDTIIKIYNGQELFFDDMEGSTVTTNWTVSGGWNYTSSDKYGGSKSMAESPSGNYSASSQRIATLNQSINLMDASYAYLSFWVKHRTENFRDKLRIQISANGINWTSIVGTTTVQEPGTLDGSVINGEPSLTGIKENWTREIFDLSEFMENSNVQLRLIFNADADNSFAFSQDDGFYIDDLKIIKGKAVMTTLSAHFLEFNAKLDQNSDVLINWDALINKDHKHFEVQRSLNGLDFTTIGTVNSIPFSFIDEQPFDGINYYRLKQVDIDGQFFYSKSINIKVRDHGISVMSFPNPVLDQLMIRFNGNAGQYLITLSDVSGKVIKEIKAFKNTGSKTIEINMASMPAQPYFLIIKNSMGDIIHNAKIIRQ